MSSYALATAMPRPAHSSIGRSFDMSPSATTSRWRIPSEPASQVGHRVALDLRMPNQHLADRQRAQHERHARAHDLEQHADRAHPESPIRSEQRAVNVSGNQSHVGIVRCGHQRVNDPGGRGSLAGSPAALVG